MSDFDDLRDDSYSDSGSESTTGWDAIDSAIHFIYGDQAPMHYGTALPASLGGNDPLHGISVYKSRESSPHWHFITYGFSELFLKESDNPDRSGFGFELTFRLACTLNDESPPPWSLDFLQNLGRYVFHTGNPLAVGHTMSLNGPICVGSPTEIRAICCVSDPELKGMDTPNGRVDFVQIVGLTLDELDAISSWSHGQFMELMEKCDPLHVTDLQRVSRLNDPQVRAEVNRRTDEEGSTSGRQYVSELSVSLKAKEAVIRFQSIVVEGTRKRLKGRIPFGRELMMISDDANVLFEPGDSVGWFWEDDVLRVVVTEAAAQEMIDTLRPTAGRYTFSHIPELEIEVLRTEIKDQDGKVLEIIG